MVFFNYATMQMAAKIVYYGPGLCGKTTNLHQIYGKTSPQARGEMVSLETETDRTLFFDLLPLDVGVIGGFKTRLQLYTVPGQVFYNTTRKLVLKGADGIVFVADSQRAMLDANIESLRNLRENLTEAGLNIDEMPVVVQLNKRDLPTALDRNELIEALDPEGRYEFVDAAAVKGEGVFETLKLISKLTLRSLRKRMMGDEPPPPRRSAPVFTVHSGDRQGDGAAAATEAPSQQVASATIEAPVPPAVEIEAHAHEPQPAEDALPEAQEIDDAPSDQSEDVAAEGVAEASDDEASEPRFSDESGSDAPAAEPEVRHVKVRSTVDIMAELEDLRKRATQAPAKGRIDVLSALDALTSSRPRRELNRTMTVKVPRGETPTDTVEVQLTFRDSDGQTRTTTQAVSIDGAEWDTLKLSIRVEPESS